ncbi:MAG: fucose isomerase [Tepidisphaerales bacterium]
MKTAYLVVSGDLRTSANVVCQPAQSAMEARLTDAFKREGVKLVRAHPIRKDVGHGFIDSQKYGMEVFAKIPDDAPVVVAEAVWQYSHHVLHGLIGRKAPILTVANWSGTWPGLVGMLNLNGSLTKAGQPYATLWSEDFTDDAFLKGLRSWIRTGKVKHDTSHVRSLDDVKLPAAARKAGEAFAQQLRKHKAILGVFDEGCMGMYNAIIPDELLHPTGVFKERLSQSTLYAKMLTVSDEQAKATFDWLVDRGVTFHFGEDETKDLTPAQVLQQCKMYIAAVRLADEFGCGAIGIQYQQGLKDLTPASDLVEGLLNNVDRPPVICEKTGKILFKGQAVPHFNEVDECAGLDGYITYHLWRSLKLPPENTLHDLRWGRHYTGPGTTADGKKTQLDDYVWVLLISGGAPPAHFIGGYKGTSSMRQPPMYFRLGGGTCRGISKPGYIVWSRIYIDGQLDGNGTWNGQLACDMGLADVVGLPDAETEDRWNQTTRQWPIMHTVFRGVSRDQMMAKHKSNHIQVVYAKDLSTARHALFVKAAALDALGIHVHLCGDLD